MLKKSRNLSSEGLLTFYYSNDPGRNNRTKQVLQKSFLNDSAVNSIKPSLIIFVFATSCTDRCLICKGRTKGISFYFSRSWQSSSRYLDARRRVALEISNIRRFANHKPRTYHLKSRPDIWPSTWYGPIKTPTTESLWQIKHIPTYYSITSNFFILLYKVPCCWYSKEVRPAANHVEKYLFFQKKIHQKSTDPEEIISNPISSRRVPGISLAKNFITDIKMLQFFFTFLMCPDFQLRRRIAWLSSHTYIMNEIVVRFFGDFQVLLAVPKSDTHTLSGILANGILCW